MVFGGVKDGDENADDTFGFATVGKGKSVRVGEEGPGEIAYGSYDYSEVIPAIPEAVVGGLVAKDLGESFFSLRGEANVLMLEGSENGLPASDLRRWKD